jgi:HSP20 family protein
MTLPVRRSRGPAERRDAFRDFEELYSELDRLVQSVAGGLASDGTWVPSADVTETDSAYIVEVELPGVQREDVDIELNDNELVITGELKERKREGMFRRRTRRVGNFEYRLRLPADLQPDKAEASLAYGVLTIRLPKAEAAKSSKIKVSESGSR